MQSYTRLYQTALVLIALLTVPGSAWAQLAVGGQVKFSDNGVAAGVTITAWPTSSGPSSSATTDSSGAYVLYVAPGTYNIGVQLSHSRFSGYQTLVQSLSITTSTQLDLTLNDLILNARILNSSGQPVSGAWLMGESSSTDGPSTMYSVSGTDGRFWVRIFPGTYSSMRLSPPPGSPYAPTSLPDETFTTTTSKDFFLADALSLGGQVKFSDNNVAAGVTITASPTSSGPSSSATTDSSGAYVLNVAPGTYNIGVQSSNSRFSGYQTLVQSLSITTSTQLDLTVNDLLLSGQILNSSGQPVSGVSLMGELSSTDGPSSMYPVSGSDGRFRVYIFPGTYSGMRLSPSPGSGYMQTSLADETFTASVSKTYVVTDVDECGYNNGGCSVNATCTNVPGSRTCTCNPGYSGDGITCSPIPARVIINEILANEPGSATSGEFVELINVGGQPIDISGWTLSDATAVRHTFASGTVLAAGKALVVFGSSSGIPPGVSNAVGASTASLNLGNSGDTVTMKDAANAIVDSFTYPASLSAADGVSMNRNPDATAGTGFVLHNSLSPLTASAGKSANGTSF